MAFAPPFVSTPGDPGRDAVQGRIARAATRRALQRNLERSLGAVDDGDDAPGSEPRSSSRPASGFARPQGSPGVAHSPGRVIPVPVAAVASPSHRDLRINRDRSKGPAFDHLVKLDECIGVLDGNDHQDPFADQGECRAVTFQVSERVLARRGRVRARARARATA